MTNNQKALLKPHAKHFSDMAAFVATRDKDELSALYDACKAASSTNCGWNTYRAAQYLKSEIEAEQHQRLRLRAAYAESTVGASKTAQAGDGQ